MGIYISIITACVTAMCCFVLLYVGWNDKEEPLTDKFPAMFTIGVLFVLNLLSFVCNLKLL